MIEVTAAIICKDNKYLICQRKSQNDNEMLWEFPGGKREQNESLEQCMIREILEELDVNIEVESVFAKTIFNADNKVIAFTFFKCQIVSGEIKLNVHNDAKWVKKASMKIFKFMPADVEIVEMLT